MLYTHTYIYSMQQIKKNTRLFKVKRLRIERSYTRFIFL